MLPLERRHQFRGAARRENRVYLLGEAGTSWIDIGMAGYRLSSIADFNGCLYASANFGGVFRYTGEGSVWEQVNTGLEDLAVMDMAVLPGAGLFAMTKNKGLFLLKEGASSWESFYHEGDLEMTVLHTSGDILYIGTAGRGIFWTCAAAATIFECGIDVRADAIQDLSLIEVEARNRYLEFLQFDLKNEKLYDRLLEAGRSKKGKKVKFLDLVQGNY